MTGTQDYLSQEMALTTSYRVRFPFMLSLLPMNLELLSALQNSFSRRGKEGAFFYSPPSPSPVKTVYSPVVRALS